MGKLDRVLLTKVTLPPLDKYKRFHLANLRSLFSRIGFHIALSLNLAPKGRPKYFIGRVPCLQPRTLNNKSKLCTKPIGTNSDLPKFIFRPKTASNQMYIVYSSSELNRGFSGIMPHTYFSGKRVLMVAPKRERKIITGKRIRVHYPILCDLVD